MSISEFEFSNRSAWLRIPIPFLGITFNSKAAQSSLILYYNLELRLHLY